MPATLDDFYTEWMENENYWFANDKNLDAYLTDKYIHLLDESTHDDNTAGYCKKWTVLYDQLPRHVYRTEKAAHIIRFFLEKAMDHLKRNKYDVSDKNLADRELCFALLPIRHHGDPVLIIHHVIEPCWRRLLQVPSCDVATIKRFLTATYDRFPVYDQLRFIKRITTDKPFGEMEYFPREIAKRYEEVLAHIPRECPALYYDSTHPVIQCIVDNVKRYKVRNVILSLSGGVDSMVCLHVLSNLYKMRIIDQVKVVHINYANREYAELEAEFVAYVSNFYGYARNTFIRRISEINRPLCMEYGMREVYESYTRKVRYAVYKQVDPSAYVVLGHNKDDCIENIMTNISHQKKYDNLRGMDVVMRHDNIAFFRPLLDVPKDMIIEYARSNHIPYLHTSTPAWSQRGQIRNKVVPVIDSWSSSFVPSLYKLADVISDAYGAIEDGVRHVFDSRELESETGVTKVVLNSLNTTQIFWSSLCTKVCKHGCSIKSIRNLMERIKQSKQGGALCITVQLNKHYQLNLTQHPSGKYTARFIPTYCTNS